MCETSIGLIIEVTICIDIESTTACTPTAGLNLPMTIATSGTMNKCLYIETSKRGSCGNLRAMCASDFRCWLRVPLGILSIFDRKSETRNFRDVDVTFSPDTRTRGVGRKTKRIFCLYMERYILPSTGAGGAPSG